MPEPRRLLPGLAGVAALVAILAAVALVSRAEIGAPARGSELRLALRAERARLEICRQRTAAELARLPAHLRALEDCDELAIDYRLTVAVDGHRRLDRTVSHRGIRRTRPLAIEEALPVSPGRHRVAVAFEPVRPPEVAANPRWLEEFAALAAPKLEQEVDLLAGRAVLIVLNEQGALQMAR